MAQKKTSFNFPVKTFVVISILALGSSVGLYVAGQSTNYQQDASQNINLNSYEDIMSTNNADGTMGPVTVAGNFSNTLAAASLGTLSLKVIDPPQGNGNMYGKQGKNGQGKGKQAIDSPFTSLIVKVKKAEVHLAQLEDKNTQIPGKLYPSPANRKPTDALTGADKWETLMIDEGLQYVDLIDLAKTGNTQTLGLTQLAAGKYTQIRLYIESATGTLKDGTEVNLTIPDKAKTIKIVRSFNITANGITNVVIDFSAERSVRKVGSDYILQPVVVQFLADN